ncbi:hypothetical protein BCR43DRAFT_493179 [Syncephalastrum racemosum]|uniref:Uncharacterized protein n=1 Tax=Syncephalastrum racemosum TaxID=13706 RepID=A0A1X2HA82_SYNRA|nr:hypothetical protein BCR43DRAFT_493179 [Syncephalastrum racemosum]
MYPGRSRISDITCFIWITWRNGPFIQSMPGISVLTARVMYIITVLFCPNTCATPLCFRYTFHSRD